MNIVVLGMHRSGTSLVSGILRDSGFFFGVNEDLTTPNDENPKGFFERKDFRKMNDDVLLSNNGDWNRLTKVLANGFSDVSIETYKSQLKEMEESLFNHSRWALKEPRICITYPLIASDLPPHKLLYIYRSPLDVAYSLWIRNKFPISYGLKLWEIYNKKCIEIFKNSKLDKLCLSYENIIDGVSSTINEFEGFIDKKVDLSFIDKNLRRSSKHKVDLSASISNEQNKVLNKLEKRIFSDVSFNDDDYFLLEQFEHLFDFPDINNKRLELTKFASLNRSLEHELSTKEKSILDLDRRLINKSDQFTQLKGDFNRTLVTLKSVKNRLEDLKGRKILKLWFMLKGEKL